jgi:hypothetical protein
VLNDNTHKHTCGGRNKNSTNIYWHFLDLHFIDPFMQQIVFKHFLDAMCCSGGRDTSTSEKAETLTREITFS